MVTFEEISELALALRVKFKELDVFLLSQEKALRSYYDQDKTNLAGLIEKTIRVRQKSKALDQFLKEPKKTFRTAPGLLTILPILFNSGNAPLAYARMCKDFTNLGGPSQDTSNEIKFIWKKLKTMLPAFEKELQKTFSKRHARKIDVSAANPELSGYLNVRVLYHGLTSVAKIQSGARKVMRSPEGLGRVLNAIRKSKLTPDKYFERMTSMIVLGFTQVIKEFPELFIRLQGPRISMTIQMVVYPMEGNSVAFFTKRFFTRGKVKVNYDPNARLTRVWFAFENLASLLHRGFEQGAHGVSSILSHELTHAFDKSFGNKGDIYDLIRIEGLATFAAAIRQPNMVSIELDPRYLSRITKWDSFGELFTANILQPKLAYTIGFVMCLGILFRRIKKRHGGIFTPYTSRMQLVQMFRNPKYRKVLEETFRLINTMNKKDFFRNYELAVQDNVAPDLFSERIYKDLNRHP